MSDTDWSFKASRLHSNSPQELYLSTLELLVPCPLESVNVWRSVQLSPTMHKGLCYFVFPSFTYLTAAVLSFVVFPFYFVFISFTPAEQWIILNSQPQWPCDQVCVDCDRFDCDEAASIIAGGTMLDRGKPITPRFTESKHFQWIQWLKEFPNWSELTL